MAYHLNITAADAKGNPLMKHFDTLVGGFEGNVPITVSMANDRAAVPIPKSNGCNRFVDFSSGDTYWTQNQAGANQNCGTKAYSQTFLDGVANQQILVIMNDAPVTTPTITVTTSAVSGFASMTGTTSAITVSPGAFHHLMLHTSAADDGGYVCSAQYANAAANVGNCVQALATAGRHLLRGRRGYGRKRPRFLDRFHLRRHRRLDRQRPVDKLHGKHGDVHAVGRWQRLSAGLRHVWRIGADHHVSR